jgi:hypothetical protein
MKALSVFLNIIFAMSLITILALAFIKPSHGRDLGQWENNDPAVREWYEHLMMPDSPTQSCCGVGDAYWCDTVHIRDKKTYCTITDDRDDVPLKRQHIPLGTEVYIPNHKLTWKDGNPTGHAILFARPSMKYDADGKEETISDINVYCYVQNGGT